MSQTDYIDVGWQEYFQRHGRLPIREDDCSYVWQVPAQNRCEWVKTIHDCNTDSVFQYTELLFCTFNSDNKLLFSVGLMPMVLWLLYMFLMLGTTADNFFCPSLAVIASVMRLSDNIAGVTILAFGNGAPDIFTSLVSGNEEGIIMFTELIGAGVFVTTMIAGSVAVVKPCRIYLKSLMRDACFYIVTVCWITYVVKDHTIHLWEAFSFVLCYVLFIVVVVLMQMYETREEKIKSRIPSESDPDVLRTYLANKDAASALKIPVRPRAFSLRTKLDIAIAMELQREKKLQKSTLSDDTLSREEDTDRPQGLFKEFLYDITPIGEEEWTNANWIFKFILIIRAPAMFLLQLFIPLVNMAAAKKGWSKLLNCFQLCVTPTLALFLLNVWHGHIGPVPVVPISLVVGTIIGVIVFRITDENRSPKYHNAFAFLGFLTAMLTVYLMAGEVMAVLQCIGHAFSISDAMLGITFLAWGNSIGDMISNIAIAKQGFPRMGYAACFGGPMFNTLLGLGLTYGMAAAQAPNYRTRMRISDMAPGCFAFLLCSLFTTIIYLNITGSIARRSYGYLLYSIYFTFIVIQFLSEFQIIHPLGTDHRPEDIK
ncbi:PREDICTED: putative sodium/calcium exchanger 7 [Dufourea novaeangliae]|uniref:putative sodium/calcium exchanger 7 n=1 Tax=Dufourea novaeangliae TaxID=178035 RepID=UPI0007671304|nr:PREDICTED: putative sodium/calcium exchanger 7 [Dufourea novaeangliae]